MRNKAAALGAMVLLPALFLAAACGGDTGRVTAGDGTDEAAGTPAVLRDLAGDTFIDEVEIPTIEAQAEASEVVVTGPVTDITDLGPADPGGSVTHAFRITVTVEESIKGGADRTVDVMTLGVGSAAELRRGLNGDQGLWMLARSSGVLVPVVSTAVLFEEDGKVVAPLAESGSRSVPEKSLAEAKEKARRGAAGN